MKPPPRPSPSSPPPATFQAYLYQKDLSRATVTSYYKSALEFLSWLDQQHLQVEQVTATDIISYQNHLKNKGLANITRNLHLNVLKHFFAYQIALGRRHNNPAQHINIRGIRHKLLYPLLSRQELEQLYHRYELALPDSKQARRNWFTHYRLSRQRNKTILGLMIWQGLTTSEINHLELTDLNLKEGTIQVKGSKKSASRTLSLSPVQMMDLLEYVQHTRQSLLAAGLTGATLLYLAGPAVGSVHRNTSGMVANIWKRLSEEVSALEPRFINFRQVRTSVITHWLTQYNLRQVQHMAGHKYVSTTESYQVNQVEDLLAAIDRYHPDM